MTIFSRTKSKDNGQSFRLLVVDTLSRGVSYSSKGFKKHAPNVEICQIAYDPESALLYATRLQPDGVLVNLEVMPYGIGFLREIQSAAPGAKLIVVTSMADALGVGSETNDLIVLSSPVSLKDLAKGVARAAAPVGIPKTKGLGPLKEAPTVFMVMAGKGGVGKSTISANFAVALAMGGNKVCLFDLELQFGSVGVIAEDKEGGKATPSLIQVITDTGIDPEALDEVLIPGPGGIMKLNAPPRLEYSALINETHLDALIVELKRRFDAVVIDTAPYLEDRMLTVLDNTDRILIVTATEVLSVDDTRKIYDYLQRMGISRERISLIVNQTDSVSYSSAREIARVVGHGGVDLVLPYAPEIVIPSIGTGRPFVLQWGSSEIAKRLTSFAAKFCYERRSADRPRGGKDQRGKEEGEQS